MLRFLQSKAQVMLKVEPAANYHPNVLSYGFCALSGVIQFGLLLFFPLWVLYAHSPYYP